MPRSLKVDKTGRCPKRPLQLPGASSHITSSENVKIHTKTYSDMETRNRALEMSKFRRQEPWIAIASCLRFHVRALDLLSSNHFPNEATHHFSPPLFSLFSSLQGSFMNRHSTAVKDSILRDNLNARDGNAFLAHNWKERPEISYPHHQHTSPRTTLPSSFSKPRLLDFQKMSSVFIHWNSQSISTRKRGLGEPQRKGPKAMFLAQLHDSLTIVAHDPIGPRIHHLRDFNSSPAGWMS